MRLANLFVITLCLLVDYKSVECENNDYFSSVADLRKLLKTEVVILAELQNYVDELSGHLESLQSEIDIIKEEHYTASKDIDGYVSNPVNAYRLIKRLHNDWLTFEDTVRTDSSRAEFLEAMTTYRTNLSFPNEVDVEGSAEALVRLQETYQLDVAQVASGILNGIKYGSSMSWQDCFVLGHILYNLRDFNHTIPWLKQSMELLIAQDYYEDPISLDFMENVAAYHQEMGDFETALNLINHIISVDATRKENLSDIKVFLKEMISDGIKQGLVHETAYRPDDYRLSSEFKLYEKVCRSEIAQTPAEQRQLHCRYHTNEVAYRLLQPFKMEELHLDPAVVLFHDVISDKQIATIKRISQTRMERSTTRTVDGIGITTSKVRTSKNAWLKYREHRTLRKLLLHVHHFSGLNMGNVEDLQVANYGIGGHYEPHWDFFTDSSFDDVVEGNRIATSIYYLSDVEEGGATAFPFLHVLVKPKKGAVLFWYNLHSSDDRDYRTKHAACPVLKGSKWIANIWIRARNQDQARPCELERNHEISIKYRDYT